LGAPAFRAARLRVQRGHVREHVNERHNIGHIREQI
jgi:hypothetical protein